MICCFSPSSGIFASMFKYKYIFALSLLISGMMVQCFNPHKAFEKSNHGLAPDYAVSKNWAALPDKKDSADAIPPNSGLKDGQSEARVDVFYIHPTVYFKGTKWNAFLDDKSTNRLVDIYPVRHQGSIFNGSCRVYAPRYRQAILSAFANENGQKALDLAYSDVKKAFEYFLKNQNQGRPFIIAGHSQGAFHGARLIQDFIDNDPELRKRFIAAYLIGGNASDKMFSHIPESDSASQVGCYIAWHTRKWGTDFNAPKLKAKEWPGYENCYNYCCVNPLTWKRDTAYAPASLNKGSLAKDFSGLDKGMADAKQSSQHVIWSHPIKGKGYLKGENYHVMDMSLYWMNIRENVAVRVDAYFKENH
jgi:Protein of unknown function (DUF3089)